MAVLKSFDKSVKEDMKRNPYLRKHFNLDVTLQKIGATVAIYRHKKHLTQTELAKKSGIPQSSIARIENGCNTSLVTLYKLSMAMDQPIKISIPD